MVAIVQREDPVLRQIAAPVPKKDITSTRMKKIIADMAAVLATQSDGVALAAPQIGVSLRMFIVAGHIIGASEPAVFINPKLTKRSKKMHWVEEGCLSIRWYYGQIKRHTNVTIEAYNQKGEKITRGAGGLLAQIFQHEIDHLDGILFTDSAKEVVDLPPGTTYEF